MARAQAPKTETVAFRVLATTKANIEKKYSGYEGRQKLTEKLKTFYASLLHKKM